MSEHFLEARMICFEVQINGKILCTAGIGDFGVLMAALSLVKRRPERNPGVSEKEWSAEELQLELSGLATKPNQTAKQDFDQQLRWLKKSVKPGDEITLRIVHKSKSDKPKSRKKRTIPKAIA
jgi:hypothetical protein